MLQSQLIAWITCITNEMGFSVIGQFADLPLARDNEIIQKATIILGLLDPRRALLCFIALFKGNGFVISLYPFVVFFFNWDSLHVRLNSRYEAWSTKEAQNDCSIQEICVERTTVKRCLLILDLRPLRSQVKGKHSIGREFQSLAVWGKKRLTQTSM